MLAALLLCSIAAIVVTWRDVEAQAPQPSISPYLLQHWATTGNGPPTACGTGAAGSLPVYTLLLQPASAGVGDVLYLAMKGPAGACEWVPIVTAP